MIFNNDQYIYLDNSKLELLRKENFHEYFKTQIFMGKILIIKNNKFILNIIEITKKILNTHLSRDEFFFLFKNIYSKINFFNLQKKFIECQKLVKQNKEIKIEFKNFLEFLNFNISKTKSDLVCLRYVKSNNFCIGNLNYVKGHRDTWASNLQEQINWWFPLNETDSSNTIYICPDFFSKPLKNNSKDWSFKEYKKKIIDTSTPTMKNEIDKKFKKIFLLKPGDILCFSGAHIHGSNKGCSSRLNLETRTITIDDKNNFKLPKNVDGEYPIKHFEWFNN
tara:strand:+ start:458 stop:1294 length:837 start_codon:yes stop_codon:yes gene_type:complete